MIQFNAFFLKALMPFRAKNDPRYYLSGIHVTPHPDGGALLIATNGHTMMCVYDADAFCSEPATFMIGNDAIKHCTRRPQQPAPLVSINPITQRLTISSNAGQELYIQPGKCLLDYAQFPDWRGIVPKIAELKPGFVDCAQSKYIEQVARSHPLRGGRSGQTAMRFWQVKATEVMVVEYDGAPEYMCFIMPIMPADRVLRYDGPGAGPLWQKAFAPAKRKTAASEKMAA